MNRLISSSLFLPFEDVMNGLFLALCVFGQTEVTPPVVDENTKQYDVCIGTVEGYYTGSTLHGKVSGGVGKKRDASYETANVFSVKYSFPDIRADAAKRFKGKYVKISGVLVDSPIPEVIAGTFELAEEPPFHPTVELMWSENNKLRAAVGLKPMMLDERLTKAAQDHANYMAKTAVFDHYANGGPTQRATKYGFKRSVQENIAMGSRSIESTFSMWKGSSGHWAAISGGHKLCGFGLAYSPSGQAYWVGVYGTE